jgi:ABC-type polysaccharide/polyol phosphate transport system ATPase subunit
MAIIEFSDVWEMYRIKFVIDGKASWENFWALKDISFKIGKGETLGIVGENGAGKSTILKLIAGMMKPDRGKVEVLDRVSGLLELGAGFQPELTGRENLYLNAGLFGLTKNQIDEKYEEIVNFANIGKFINAPVKCYSQGMFVRLAFGIAIHMDPDILLIDDTLAVGDEYFQRKCIKKIFQIKEQNKAIIFVTHDMNMLSRLCKRALFLKDGRIIKDGLINGVVPLYTQMIGTRKGVGILERPPLNLVFNNGQFFLNWQDKLLTPNSGAYTVFRIANKWYSSLQADWEVKREDENKLIATGKFYQLALTQIWRLELTNDYAVKWDIEMELKEPLEIQEGCTNIMLTNEYARWFTTLEKGKFPLINDKDKNWQELVKSNISRNSIGVEARENSGSKIPSLAFEHSNPLYQNQAHILNTDYLVNCRVLQYKTLGLQNYSAIQANRFIYFSGKIILDIPNIGNYLKNLQDEFILSDEKLRLIFDNGQGILYYNGVELTKGNHMGSSIYANGGWFPSNLAHWEIKKEKNNKLIAKGIWWNLPIVLIWEIEILSDSSFVWKIDLEVTEEVNIEEQHAYLMCCKDYKYWFCDYGKGKFPDDFLEVPMDMVQRCIPDGTIGLVSHNNQLPGLSLRFSKDLNNLAKIINSNFYNRARLLRVERVESERNTRFLPGRYPTFAIKVISDKDKQIYIEDSANKFQRGKLGFIFDNGKGCIYWNGIELTKRLSLYTSLRSEKRWYDSASSTIWKIEGKNIDTIRALGKWLHLPLNQYWEIKLEEDNIIEFSAKMIVDKEIEVDRLQMNLMLSERYSQWVTNKEKGLFPLFKENIDDDWDCVWSGKDTSKCIGVLESLKDKNSLPTVIFSPQRLNSDWYPNIINSDICHRGRVLQYLNTKKMKIQPGEYPYFSGRILIET